MLVVFLLLSVAYRRIQSTFDASVTNLKRIDAASKSPIFSAFSQVCDAAPVLALCSRIACFPCAVFPQAPSPGLS